MTISYLEIRNFKSIKELHIDGRRVSLFIGPPNTGKSNPLEAPGGFSLAYAYDLKSVIQRETLSNLFYNEESPHKEIIYKLGNLEELIRQLKEAGSEELQFLR